ncbi:hypothetical protein ACFQU1_23515 [Chelatococcus sp. GCM10030263]|uniref:calcium-binding protein n=1 Tax=Chelatococcus sp. GCM10030263 TaxID=3273387 RepID=UPI00361C9899
MALTPDENSALSNSTTTDRAAVMQAIVRLYETVHQRVPDVARLNSWTADFEKGETNLASLAEVLVKSDQFALKHSHQDKESLFRGFLENALGGESDLTTHDDLAWRQDYLERDSSELAAMISENPAVVEHIRPYVDAFLVTLGEDQPFTGSVYQIPSVRPNPATVLPVSAASDVVDAIVNNDRPEEIEQPGTAKEATPEIAPVELTEPTETLPTSSEDLPVGADIQRGGTAPVPARVGERDPSLEMTGELLPVTAPPPLEIVAPTEVKPVETAAEADDRPEPSRVAKEAAAETAPAELTEPTETAPTSSEDLAVGTELQRGSASPLLPEVGGRDLPLDRTGDAPPVSDPPLEREVPIEVEDERPLRALPQSSPQAQDLDEPRSARLEPSAVAPTPAAEAPTEPKIPDAPSEDGEIAPEVVAEEMTDRKTVQSEPPVVVAPDPDAPVATDPKADNRLMTDPAERERSDIPPATDEPDVQAVRWHNVSKPQVITAKVGEAIGLRREHTIPAVTYEGSEGSDDRASIIIDQDLGPLRVDGIEHLNIIVRGESSLVLYAAQAKTITVSGEGAFNLALPDNAPAGLTLLDASALKGNFVFSAKESQPLHVIGASGDNEIALSGSQDNVVKTSSGNDVIRTGGGADDIDTGGGSDTVSAGGGDDVITLGSGADKVEIATDTTSTLSLGNGNMTKLVGFNAAEGDTIVFPFLDKATVLTPENQTAVQAAADKFTTHASLYRLHKAAKEEGGQDDGQIGTFVHNNKTYVFIDSASNTLIEAIEVLQLPASSFADARGPLTSEFAVGLAGGITVDQADLT